MDINVTVKLTCDEYMTHLIFTAIEFFENISNILTPLASVPKTEPAAVVQDAPVPIPTTASAPTASAPTVNATQTAPTIFSAPAQPPVVPQASAKAYTLADLQTAAGPLMDQGKVAELMALITKFGVQSLTEIPPEKYGEVATELRALGAKL